MQNIYKDYADTYPILNLTVSNGIVDAIACLMSAIAKDDCTSFPYQVQLTLRAPRRR
jgi:hypothetical protein